MSKVCHITVVHPRYDIRIFIKETTTLAKNSYDVSLIVADEFNDEVNQQVKIYTVGKPQSRLQRMFKTSKKVYAKILQLKPDIVHFHDPELMLIALKLVKHNIKVIYDVHEDLPKQVMSKHWLPRLIRPLVAKLVERLESYCSKKFYGIITATPIIGARFLQYNQNTLVICNYPSLLELPESNVSWDLRENRLCYIGSIAKTRGIVPLINSLAKSKLTLDLAGSFSGDIDLVTISQLLGSEYINYLGVIDRTEVIALLNRVKVGIVTLLPTPSYIESLPIKMFEYMLAGIPIVASNFPLWSEIIEKYQCGILVDPNDEIAIANACNLLINDAKTAWQLGFNGKQAALKFFNWEQESIKLIDFYRDILVLSKNQYLCN